MEPFFLNQFLSELRKKIGTIQPIKIQGKTITVISIHASRFFAAPYYDRMQKMYCYGFAQNDKFIGNLGSGAGRKQNRL